MPFHWGYGSDNGPSQWVKLYPHASGHRQSPININTSWLKNKAPQMYTPALKWHYVAEDSKSLVNPGYCWKVDVNGKNSELTGGPLGNNIYKLEQFHCHWGCNDELGSEHTVDGVPYSGELHLVHWNSTKFSNFLEASAACDGLAVLAVFLKIGHHHNEMAKITNLLPLVVHKGDRVTLPGGCNPTNILPTTKGYWTYEGSLTTPPCNESVTWIIFKTPIEVSKEQIFAMRNINCYEVKEEEEMLHYDNDGKVINNFRPPMPIGTREIREIGEH